jgi:hypothetical protein
VLLKIVYLLVRRLLSLAVLVFRGDRAKNAELLALQHENAVLRTNFTASFDAVFQAAGTRILRTAVRTPVSRLAPASGAKGDASPLPFGSHPQA